MFRLTGFMIILFLLVPGRALAQDFVLSISFDGGGWFDRSFNEASYTGAERFREETGVEYRDFELTQLTMPSFRDFNDVSIAANGSALIVGERGTLVLRTADGWVEAASPDSRALRAAWIGEDGAALAAGRNGVLLSLAAGGTD